MLSQTIIHCKRQIFLLIIFLLELSLWRWSTWLEVWIMQEPQLLLMFYVLVQRENSSICFLGSYVIGVGLSNWGAHDLIFCCAGAASFACVGSDGCGCGCGGFYLVFPCSGRGAHDIEVGIVQKPLWRRWRWWWWGKAPAADQAKVSLSVTDNRVMSTSLLLLPSLLYVIRWKVYVGFYAFIF